MTNSFDKYSFGIEYLYHRTSDSLMNRILYINFREKKYNEIYLFWWWYWDLDIEATQKYLKKMEQLSSGEIEKFGMSGQVGEFYIEIFKEKAQILHTWRGGLYRDDKYKWTDGKDRNTLNPDKERIKTEDLKKLLEERLAFLEKTKDFVLVDKEWVKEEYQSEI